MHGKVKVLLINKKQLSCILTHDNFAFSLIHLQTNIITIKIILKALTSFQYSQHRAHDYTCHGLQVQAQDSQKISVSSITLSEVNKCLGRV